MKNGERRFGFDIIAGMLDAARFGVMKTHLMYRCNMSFTQFERYLNATLYNMPKAEIFQDIAQKDSVDCDLNSVICSFFPRFALFKTS